MNEQLGKVYQEQAELVVKRIDELYLQMIDEGDLSLGNMYKQDRYYKLLANINKRLRELGLQEISIMDRGLMQAYFETGLAITGNAQFAIVNADLARKAVESIWCTDGQSWSDRIWKHKAELQSKLQQGIMDCVVTGRNHTYLIKELRNDFNVGYNEASRIVRTEINHVQNQAAMRGYLDAGYTMYQFISPSDNRSCGECEKLDGQVFLFSEAQEGVNFPPMHPNCRSNIIGYKEK